jgi:hypothetical protein
LLITTRAGELVRLGDHQEAVEHARMRLGVRRGEDDDDLIHVGGDDALTLPAAWCAARETRPAWQDLGDGPRVAGIVLQEHVIAHRELERLRRRGDGVAPQRAVGAATGVRFLHSAAQRRLDDRAALAAHSPHAARAAQDDPLLRVPGTTARL